MIGETVSNYRILEQLGVGGMGVVYKAEDTKLKRTVALKFLPPEWTRDAQAKERFMLEAQAASSLDHHNICTIHEIGQTDDGQLFIVMACYEGETLTKKIERSPLKVEEAIEIAMQIAQGLEKAHRKQIVHRDIKPANIMITTDGVVKILDFGLAKLSGKTKMTKEGTTLGTAAYLSPEQARGEEVDYRTDIWALGIVLFEMLIGRSPFEGDYEQAVVYSILNNDPPAPTGLRSGLPMELERVINKCLAKEADERYQHAIEIHVDLKRIKSEAEALSRSKVSAQESLEPGSKGVETMKKFKPISNPYIVGNPIKRKNMFYGRKDDFEFIERKLQDGNKSFLIVFCGERRSGKTSILFQILNGQLGENFLPILSDMQTMAGLKNDGEFFEKVARETFKTLDSDKLRINDYDFFSDQISPYKVFDKLLDDIHALHPDKNILFLIDEYELIETKIDEGSLSSNFVPFLAGILESERKISFIFTGSKKLNARDSHHWNILFGKSLYRNVSFLSERDTMRLITEPVNDLVEYDKEVLSGIYRLTAGQPFYTQVVCQNIVDYLNEHRKSHVVAEDLEFIVDEILENPLPQMIYFWNALPDSNKLSLSLVSESLEDPDGGVTPEDLTQVSKERKFGLNITTKSINTALDDLFHLNILKKASGKYSFELDLFRRWIKRDHSIWRVMKEVGQTIEEGKSIKSAAAKPGSKKPIGVAGILRWAVPALVVVAVGALALRYFSTVDSTPVKTDPEPAAISEDQADNSEVVQAANDARQAMENSESDALSSNAAQYAKEEYESALQTKNRGISEFDQGRFASAGELFMQAAEEFRNAGNLALNRTPEPPSTDTENRSKASQARRAMTAAKNQARAANAEELSLFRSALQKEQEGIRKFNSGEFLDASILFEGARILFGNARTQGVDLLKSQSTAALEEMNIAKNEARNLSADTKAKATFDRAVMKENEGQSLLSQEEYVEAEKAFAEAQRLFTSAANESKNSAVEGEEAISLQAELQKTKAKLNEKDRSFADYGQAQTAESRAETQMAEGSFSDAIQNYRQAISLYEQIIKTREDQIRNIETMVRQYERALQNKDIRQLSELYVSFSSQEQKQWSDLFKNVEQVEAQMQIEDYNLRDNASTVFVGVHLKYSGFVNSDNRFKWEMGLEKTADGWLISNINR